MIVSSVKSLVQELCSDFRDRNIGVVGENNIMFDKDFNLTAVGFNTVLNQTQLVFKNAMFKNDKDEKYTVLSRAKQIKDPVKEKEIKDKYKTLQKKIDEAMSRFRDEHPEMYKTIESAPNVAPYCSVELNESYGSKVVDVDVANYIFRELSKEAKSYSDENKDKILIATKRIIIPEFKGQYDDFKASVIKSVGMPSPEEIKEEIQKSVPDITVQGRSLRRSKIDNEVVGSPKESLANEVAGEYIKDLFKKFA